MHLHVYKTHMFSKAHDPITDCTLGVNVEHDDNCAETRTRNVTCLPHLQTAHRLYLVTDSMLSQGYFPVVIHVTAM